MIAKITGTVQEFLLGSAIVDVNGVGYEVFLTSQAKENIIEGQKQTFYIAENIKEDEYTLYGFLDIDTRYMYYQLTSVSGVGPKAAMSILNAHSTQEVSSAIVGENIALFSGVSGIGRKTAQRIILDLKGKLVTADEEKQTNTTDPAYQALLSLGYKPADAKKALENVSNELDTQTRVKQALGGKK